MSNRLMGRRALVAVVVALAALPVPAAGAQPDVLFAGDSIGNEGRVAIRNQVERGHRIVWYETADSATVLRFHDRIVDEVSRPGGPDIVVLELGVGNAHWGTTPDTFRSQVRDLLRAILPHVACVRWLDQKPGGTRYYPGINARAATLNEILREEVNRFARARTVHYAAWTALAGDAAFRADLLHPNHAGQRGLARLVAQATDGCDPALTSGPFWDVRDDFWAATAIAWVGRQRLIDGYANDTYRAVVGGIEPSLSRVDEVRALWRRAGRPEGYPPAPWPDTPAAAARPLAWAAAEEVVSVDPDRRFRPNLSVTRVEAVQWLYRAEGRPDPWAYPDPGFTDVAAGARRALRWAAGVGAVTATPGGPFHPDRVLSRAQAAVFLYGASHPAPPPEAESTTTTTSPTTTTTSPTTGGP